MSRNFCFTLNNYTPQEEEKVQNLECRFLQYGREVGASGTPHLQGYIVFINAKTLSAAIKFINVPRMHVEIARGGVEANIKYTGKDNDVFRKGDPPITKKQQGEKGREYWLNARQAMREGDEDNIPGDILTKQPRLVDEHRRRYLATLKLEDVTEKHLWFHGKPRTGKSRKAREFEDIYDKDLSKWWDGYSTQATVLIDDIDRSHNWMLHNLKRWADRYPFPAESKGLGKVQIRPKKIIVTSNYTIQEIWPNATEHEPLLERFEQVLFGPEGARTTTTPNPFESGTPGSLL